ncbi:probable alt1 - alanine aminotransferase [Melanopsichium pennsylvanicum]|uniref:Glutamate pyruvate transaminase n=2 Tax=Melanopsichium pennsylvanicum TaxID=63383 RepID=A0AAJ5C5Y4_9BASI|nr:probable alt1-alanine aminotransferase (C-terminal fragment) [Melanopsichium pennsylvanicum 4]SNX85247.1 probable alt1 - alanine aminotransferase [Melanopsichium pennsylvanicum]
MILLRFALSRVVSPSSSFIPACLYTTTPISSLSSRRALSSLSSMTPSTSQVRDRSLSQSSVSSRSSSTLNPADSAYGSSYTTQASSSRGFASSSKSHSAYKPVLTTNTINPHVLEAEYAVRGEISNRANKYAAQIADGDQSLPFSSVVTANIGNPQQQPYLAQKPLTFWRQVAALTEYPELMNQPGIEKTFPKDTLERAKLLLEDVGSVGAYSHSKGATIVRKHVAEFIQSRDGYPSDPELIYLTTGASGGVQLLLQVIIAGPQTGVMIPIPQYPLYSAALALYNAQPVKYDLNPFDDWSLDVNAMSKSIDEARANGVDVRACAVINPGNPTGQCLSYQNIQDLMRMAYSKRVVLLADEVYQANIYQPETRPFHSFKKVLMDFSNANNVEERRIANSVELVSFHSISKGVSGECGRRGGYFELTNMDPEVEAEIYKLASISLCPSLQGQIGVDMLVKPPTPGSPSYELYKHETEAIHATLLQRSENMATKFAQLPGVEVEPAQGALYLFPRVTLPKKAHEAAKQKGKKVDEFYCLEMLDHTGICVVPGSGFGKMPEKDTGACFFRTTVLAKETDEFIQRYGKFHTEFLQKYS